MKVWFSLYELKPSSPLGARARTGPRHGALLRVEYPGFGMGYADCHPWPELGDAPLSEQLHRLSRNELTALTSASMAFSEEDARARAEDRSCFQAAVIPASHWLLTDPSRPGALAELEQAVERGFERIKVKLGPGWDSLFPRFLDSIRGLPPQVRIRLDFNSTLSPEDWSRFLRQLEGDRNRIDFIEDPTPWSETEGFPPAPGIRLALDRNAPSITPSLMPSITKESRCPPVLVLKPALGGWKCLWNRARKWNRQCVVTSYLDHPIGQACAAWAASQCAAEEASRVEICGLLSHSAYEKNEFSERIADPGPVFPIPAGTGWGFNDLLEGLSWERLR